MGCMKYMVALAVSLLPSLALAASVGPVYKINSGGERTGVLSISNDDPSRVYQITVDQMVVEGGVAVRKPSSNIRFAPSVIRVEKGAQQSVRYIKGPDSTGSEEFYRVSVTEMAEPGETGMIKLVKQDLAWIWRAPNAQPLLSAKWEGEALVVTNTGTVSARLVSPQSGATTRPGLLGYVLPGETRRFSLPGFSHGPVSFDVDGKRQVVQ